MGEIWGTISPIFPIWGNMGNILLVDLQSYSCEIQYKSPIYPPYSSRKSPIFDEKRP